MGILHITHRFDIGRQFRNTWFVAVILFFVCLGTYSNSLRNNFMLDDQGLMLQDKKMQSAKFLLYQFMPDLQKHLKLEEQAADVYYRPLQNIILIICFILFRENILGYHLLNLALFALCCFSIYLMVNVVFNDQLIALLTSLLFAVHPINCIIVDYITAIIFAVQVILMSLGIVTFLNTLKGQHKIRWYSASLVCFLAAMLCHEIAVTFPFYLMALLYFIRRETLRRVFLECLPYLILLALFFLLRLHLASLNTSILQKINVAQITLPQYLATFLKLMLWYLSKFFVPNDIFLVWTVPFVTQGIILWNLLFAGLVFICFWYFFWYNRDSRVSCAALWFFIGFLPVGFACFFQPRYGLLIEPHWLIFPSIGFFILMAIVLKNAKKYLNQKFAIVVILLLLALANSTRQMNRLWGDEIEYFRRWHAQLPHFKFATFHLAKAYFTESQYQPAKKYFLEAIEGQKSDWQIFTNLGLIALAEKDYTAALQYSNQALQIQPKSALIYNDIGTIYVQLGQRENAEKFFVQATQLDRFLLEPRLNLALVYEKEGRDADAQRLYLENLQIDSGDTATLILLAKLYLKIGNAYSGEVGLKILNSSRKIAAKELTGLGILYALDRREKLAFEFFRKAIAADPRYIPGYIELGKFYGNYENWDAAIVVWQKGMAIDPSSRKEFGALINRAQELRRTIKGRDE